MKNSPRSTLALLMFSTLAGCYGTKVGPPIKSALPPPGLYTLNPGPIALPSGLSELLALYRQTLVEQSHQLSPAEAAKYADAEIAAIGKAYAGRDLELRNEVAARLEARLASLPARPQTTQHGRFPQDPADRREIRK